jgi:hypothetical protein
MIKENEKPAFDIYDRGYNVKAWYLSEPKGDALIEITKGNVFLRKFLFPAYKIWNIAAHFKDIVDGEIDKNIMNGYRMAASDGFGGTVIWGGRWISRDEARKEIEK